MVDDWLWAYTIEKVSGKIINPYFHSVNIFVWLQQIAKLKYRCYVTIQIDLSEIDKMVMRWNTDHHN